MATFKPTFAVDTNGLPVADMSGTIHAVSDVEGTTPLAITDLAGIPMATATISSAGVNQAFIAENYTQVLWVSSDKSRAVILDSLEGLETRAATAAATAESVASAMSEFVAKIGVPGGVAPLNAEGNVVDADGDVVGNDTRRPGAVTFATGSTTARPTQSRDVMVLWLTDGSAPVNAVPGIDYWLNAGVVR